MQRENAALRFKIPLQVLGAAALFSFVPAVIAQSMGGPSWAPPDQCDPAFRKVVFLGDSISAGYQNGSLLDTQQVHGWPSLLAHQAHIPLALPLIAAPGYPAVTIELQGGFPPVLGTEPGTTTGRVNPDVSPDDLAVPGYRVADVFLTMPVLQPTNPTEQLVSYVLGYPAGTTGTALQQALAKNPSLLYLWIGNNDALSADSTGDPSQVTPMQTFALLYAQLLLTLRAGSSAPLIVGNIPDVTKVAYMTPASEMLLEASASTGLPPDVLSNELQLFPGDLLNETGLLDFETDVQLIEQGATSVALPPSDVLTAAEVLQLQATVDGYNQIIAQDVAAAGGTVVDTHALLDHLAKDGAFINGFRATTAYGGGIFSLDGIHLTNTGYALIGNLFIEATNQALHTRVQRIDVGAVAAADPLFQSAVQAGSSSPGKPHIGPVGGHSCDSVVFRPNPFAAKQ